MKNTRATPPVSIIVPCYNHGSSLPALLESIARQSLRGCEVRIVDDGSSEAIEPFIEPYRDAGNFTLNVMRQPARKGTLQARLAGILATRAPVIMFADADDQLYGGDALEFHYRLLLKERADIVHFRTLSADESRIEAVDRHARPLHALLVGERIFAAYCRTQRFNIWGKLYAREMCLRNMDFCLQDRKIWGHEDIWLSTWFFFNARRYVGSEKIGYAYHPHGDIWNFPSRIAARLITDRSMLEEMLPFFEQEGVQRRIANDCRRNMRKYLFESVSFLCARCFGEANGFFPQLFRLLTSGEDDVDILRAVECAAREATEEYGIFKDKLLEIREYLLGAPLGIRGEEEGALQHVPDTEKKCTPPIKEIFGKEAIDMNDRLTAVCFGAGSLARSVIPALDTDKVHIAAFVDERPGARGGVFSGRPVIDLPEMLLMNFDYVFIACRPVEAVSSRLLALGVSAKKIVSLDFESFLLAQQGFEPQDCQAALAAYLSSFPGLAGCFSLPTLLRSCGLSASLPRRGHTESKRFCPAPFTGASVEHDYDPAFADYKRGDVLLCCWAWFEDRAAFAGNITDYDSFMEVWNSERAQRFRASILDGSFKYCNREMCSSLKYAALPFADDVVEPALRKIIDAQSVAVPAPQEIRLNYDLSCNLACPQCRRERVMAKGRELGTIREFHDRVVASLDNPKRLVLTNGGDALASPVFLPFLQNFDVTRFPETKITLRTNGILFTPKIWESLRPAHAHIDEVNISVDAASEETYKKVRKPGGFPTLLKNLGFIQQIRKESAPFKLVLNFCIQKANYTEMGDFVSLGERYGADGVMFGVLAPNGEYMGAAYGENAVHIETHPEHGEYLKKLADPRLGHPAVSLPVTKRQWRELRAQEALVPEVSERPAVSVLWFGTGSMTQELLPAVRRESVRIPAFIDEREHMRGAIFHGAPVLGLEQAASHLCDYVLVGARPFALIADKLKKAGIPEDKIVNLDFRVLRPRVAAFFASRF